MLHLRRALTVICFIALVVMTSFCSTETPTQDFTVTPAETPVPMDTLVPTIIPGPIVVQPTTAPVPNLMTLVA